MSGTALHIEVVRSQADIPEELWSACFPPPLEGRWWYETLEQSRLDDQFAFLYALLRASGRPVGIAPLFLMKLPLEVVVPDPLMPIGRLLDRMTTDLVRPPTLFVGSPCADEGTFGLLPGIDRRAALLRLQDFLIPYARSLRARLLIWKDFPAAWSEDFAWLMAQRRLFRSISYPGTMLDLPGSSKEQYFANLKGSRRQNLRRNLRRSAERVAVRVEALQRPDAATLDTMFDLFWQTYSHASTKFERLNRRFFEIIAEKPIAHFVLLREKESDRLIGFVLCFLMGKHAINKFIVSTARCPRACSCCCASGMRCLTGHSRKAPPRSRAARPATRPRS
jgi:hypothetical protein